MLGHAELVGKGALMPVISDKILECSTIHTDGWDTHDELF